MIRIDFLESEGEPTLWILIDSPLDREKLCTLLSRLAENQVRSVDTGENPQLFKHAPRVANLILAREEGDAGSSPVTFSNPRRELAWRLSPESWLAISRLVCEMLPNRHHYVDYPDTTVYISYLEKLRDEPLIPEDRR
jgi:hypothetical protein